VFIAVLSSSLTSQAASTSSGTSVIYTRPDFFGTIRDRRWEAFKKFASRGNVIDLAVGVIIGAACSKIVNTRVDGIIMPPVVHEPPGAGGHAG